MATPAWLGSPLKWMASLGTGTLSGLAFYAFGLLGFSETKMAPALFAIVAAGVAKGVGWVVSNYGPQPVAMKKISRPRPRKPPPPAANGPNKPDDLPRPFGE